MKILHMIAPSARMIKTYVDTIQMGFPHDEHFFYATKDIPVTEQEFFSDENMIHMDGSNRIEKMSHVKAYCESADVIVWHGFLYPFRMMLFLYGNRRLLKKSIWVMWGIDLYNWKNPHKTPRALFENHVNKFCRTHVAAAIALLEPDVAVFRETISKKVPCYVAAYPISYESFRLMEERRRSLPRANGVTCIQIGNNAHSFNNHNKVLDDIAHLDKETTHYYLPLSYGDTSDWKGNASTYKQDLIERVVDTFEERGHVMQRMMPQNEYTNYLWNIDVAIFGAERQNALGNILKLLYMGNKVFLARKNPLYDFFLKNGVGVENADELSTMTEEEFYAPVSDNEASIKWIRDTYYPPSAIRRWGQAFDHFRVESVEAESFGDSGIDEDITAISRKPNILRVTPYASARKRLPEDWHFVALLGTGESMGTVAQSVIDSEPYVYLTGAIMEDDTCDWCVVDEQLPEFIESCGVMADIDHHLPTTTFVLTWRDPLKRRSAMAFLREHRELIEPFISKKAVVGYRTEIGEGSFVSSGSTIYPMTEIGEGAFIDSAIIGSSCIIGDYVTLLPGAICGNNCILGDNVVVESGVVIPDGSKIPADTVVKR